MARSQPLDLGKTAAIFTPLCMLLLSACSQHGGMPAAAPADVGVVVVKQQSVPIEFSLPGRTTAIQVSDIRPQVSGVVQSRLFKEGGDVKQGEQLYQIDPATYKAIYDKAAAALATAQALADRYKPLAAARAVSRQQYQDAAAAAQEDAAELEQARINLTYTRVLAPIAGRIGRSAVTPGALVTSGQAASMATITQLDPIYVDVTESADDLLRLRRDMAAGRLQKTASGGAKVRLTLADGSSYDQDGELQFSEVNVDQGTGMVTLRAIFPNAATVLLPGMFVHAQIDEGSVPDGILIPQESVQHDSTGNAYVYVVDQQGKAQRKSITAQRMIGASWLIGGLKTGDRVITQGLQKLRPGMPVNVSANAADDPDVTEHMTTNDPSAQ